MQQNRKTPKHRYSILEQLGEGGMGVVYRVVDLLNGLHVALKEVRIPTDQLSFDRSRTPDSLSASSQLALANEFRVLASLRHPNIISVLDYGFDEKHQPFFTMDLLEAPRNILKAAEGQSIEAKIHLILQVLQALLYLHRRGIIHRDIKPDNILVTADGTVKVMDFGLAVPANYQDNDSGTVTGTMAYIAPEVFSGQPVSMSSDLYAVGVIFYEMLTGYFPYDRSNVGSLIMHIMSRIPDVSSIDPRLAPILETLLAKNPESRYNSIDALIEDLCASVEMDRPAETLTIRESFLQASTFVGREAEMKQVEAAIQAAKTGTGSILLLAGESGVGKSRLIDEIRIRALVDRALVVKGQAIAEGSTLYRVWRDVLQWLSIVVTPNDYEASVLVDIVPKLEQLIGRPIVPAPQISPSSAQERITQVIIGLLRRITYPIVIVLEDLHWAGSESITLLQAISDVIKTIPILIIGSYRSDEAPQLSESFPDTQRITLKRLNRDEIANISQSILGNIGSETRIIALLEGETNGNVFFVIETIRALAEEAGELRRIAEQPLPQTIVAGGILAILQRRLLRVPEIYRPILIYAALIGRKLDVKLLGQLMPDIDLNTFALACAEVAILEAQEDTWQFTHDKLREQVIRELQANLPQYQQLQRDVAQAAENIYADDPDFLPALAHHWVEADVADKAVHYLERAGSQMYMRSYEKAAHFIDKAMSYDQRVGVISEESHLLRYGILSMSHYGMGNNNQAALHLQDFLKYLGAAPIPEPAWQVPGAILRELAIQFRTRRNPQRYIGKKDIPSFDEKMFGTLSNLPVVYMTKGSPLKALLSTFTTLNIIESLKPDPETSPSLMYAAVAYFTGLIGLHGVAHSYVKLTKNAMLNASPSLIAQSQAILGLYAFQRGEWDTAETGLRDVIALFEQTGELHSHTQTRHILSMLLMHRGKYREALTFVQTDYENARDRRDSALQLYLLFLLGLVRWRVLHTTEFDDYRLLNDEDAARKTFEKAFGENKVNEGYYFLARAYLNVQVESYQLAFEDLKRCVEIIHREQLQRTTEAFDLYAEICALCDALLTRGRFSLRSNELIEVMQYYEKTAKTLKQYAGVFVFAQPRTQLIHGWLAYHKKNPEKAQQHWKNALKRAQELAMPYEEALAHAALAQGLPTEQQYRKTALALFEQIGIHPEVAQQSLESATIQEQS